MKKREAEKQTHIFEKNFANECKMYDLQGLLLNSNDEFTAAVEAFTYSEEEGITNAKTSTFSEEEWEAKLILSESLNIHFFLFLHKNGTDKIVMYDITQDSFDSDSITPRSMTEQDFIEWWKQHKQTIQNKQYRPELRNAISGSYFDDLLESNGLKWGGNIDGFLILTNEKKPMAIIENRFTKIESIKTYDPLKYYSQDIYTWKPLILLCKTLQVPLVLCVYSKITEEKNMVGIAILDINKSPLSYKNVKPGNNIFTDIHKAKKWLLSNI